MLARREIKAVRKHLFRRLRKEKCCYDDKIPLGVARRTSEMVIQSIVQFSKLLNARRAKCSLNHTRLVGKYDNGDNLILSFKVEFQHLIILKNDIVDKIGILTQI